MLSNVIAPQHVKIRHAHIGDQKGRRLLFIYRGQSLGTLTPSLAPFSALEQAAISVIAGSSPVGQPEH